MATVLLFWDTVERTWRHVNIVYHHSPLWKREANWGRKCVSQLLLGSFLRTCPSAIGKFSCSLSLVTVPEAFAKVNLTQFPSRFCQEPITRSVQLPYCAYATAFSQVGLFLDKLLVLFKVATWLVMRVRRVHVCFLFLFTTMQSKVLPVHKVFSHLLRPC